MAFFVYIAILLISISGILLELDWLTKPKLDTKSPVQTAASVLPAKPKASANFEGPTGDLTPVYPKTPDEPRVTVPSTGGTPRPAATSGDAPPAPPQAEAAAQAAPSAPAQTSAQAEPQQARPAETTGAAPASEPVDTPANMPAAAPVTPGPAAQTAGTPPNRCEVQACAAAYASFRASDCTYQPFEGPRRVCQKPPAARSEQTARRRGNSDELREVEAAGRRIRPGAALRDRDDVRGRDAVRGRDGVRGGDDMRDDDDADFAPLQPGQRVIVIERSAGRPW